MTFGTCSEVPTLGATPEATHKSLEFALATVLLAHGGNTVATPAYAVGPLAQEGILMKLTPEVQKTLCEAIWAAPWPQQRRTTTTGMGTCLGITYEKSVARLGHWTKRCESLIKLINSSAKQALAGRQFFWGSIQVNVNSASTLHKDSNNIGLSMMVMLGSYTGGMFHMEDESHTLNKPGDCLVFDGTKAHYSDPFEGRRISLVLFLHKGTADMSPAELGHL